MTQSAWPAQPVIHEINTWVWLKELSAKVGKRVTLKSVPVAEWDALARHNIDAVWLMGVWERSPAGRTLARTHSGLQAEYHAVLPDLTEDDIVGSPYCVHRYVVDKHLGGPEGLAKARQQLAKRGLRLLLDFVPNHVAPDHPWLRAHPEYFIQGKREDLDRAPQEYMVVGDRVIACGRDPYFPPWTDTAQLNAFSPGLRAAARATLVDIADQCDGVRCDMAMLLISSVFQRTWGDRAGAFPAKEYWTQIIGEVRAKAPGFLFVAEAYWDLEYELLQQGFDYCYDKRLYDRLVHGDASSVRAHLSADPSYQARLLRFIENHDEPRASATFTPDRLRAASVICATVPGATLYHEGQRDGRKVKLPVQLGRRPAEPQDTALESFYASLAQAAARVRPDPASWKMCNVVGWPDNSSNRNLLGWCWGGEAGRMIAAVNFSPFPSQGRLVLPWRDLEGREWKLTDLLTGEVYVRDGNELVGSGLFVDLSAWSSHLFSAEMQ